MTDQACCACRTIRHDTVPAGDGTVRGKWACIHCGSEFVRTAAHAALEAERDRYVRGMANAWGSVDRLRAEVERLEAERDEALHYVRAAYERARMLRAAMGP